MEQFKLMDVTFTLDRIDKSIDRLAGDYGSIGAFHFFPFTFNLRLACKTFTMVTGRGKKQRYNEVDEYNYFSYSINMN